MTITNLRTTFEEYTDGEGASHALVGDLATGLIEAAMEPVHTGEGFAVYPDGRVIDWRDKGERPWRRTGATALTDPESFGKFVERLAVAETTVWADKDAGRFLAVFNDHPPISDSAVSTKALGGYRDDTASLALIGHEDWAAWMAQNGRLMPQRQFGEMIEGLAHTIVSPSAATMLEVATTLTMKRELDYGSRVRLDNGDVEFKFEETSMSTAGRRGGNSIEIPSSFVFETPVWQGTDPVRVEARLRTRASGQGVEMGYRLIRLGDSTDAAFEGVIVMVRREVPEFVPIFIGTGPGRGR